MKKMKIENTLPTPQLCALMAYEQLKNDRRNSDLALAWATLGNLLTAIEEAEEAKIKHSPHGP